MPPAAARAAGYHSREFGASVKKPPSTAPSSKTPSLSDFTNHVPPTRHSPRQLRSPLRAGRWRFDPTYAPAYAGLSECHSNFSFFGYVPPGEAYPRAKAAAVKALELDDSLAEAHAALGNLVTNVTGFWWREGAGRSSRAPTTDRRARSTVGALSIKI